MFQSHKKNFQLNFFIAVLKKERDDMKEEGESTNKYS